MISLRPQQPQPRFSSIENTPRPDDKDIIRDLVTTSGLGQVSTGDISSLAPDGSDRIFYRIASDPASIAIFPGPPPHGLAEAVSCYTIGCHLADSGVAVPQIYGQQREYRVILMEDVGSLHLYNLVSRRRNFAEVRPLYFEAVEALFALQVTGRHGFDLRSCWGSRHYDFDLMMQQESDYFLQALCRDYLALVVDLPALQAEMVVIARQAAREPADFLLHRDFQCRNLMVQGEEKKIRIIDFQGARLGPLGYDLASLLIDPYAALMPVEQEEIFSYYVALGRDKIGLDPDCFRRGFYFLAIQRNLQILGAFAFLSQKKGKGFFQQFITPALHSLDRLLNVVDGDFPALSALVAECLTVHKDAQELT